jgi:hypothetical protein
MTTTEQFFYDNAGFSFDSAKETSEQGHARCAVELAKAERFAQEQGWSFAIEPDADEDDSWMDDESEEYQAEWRGKAWSVVLWDETETRVLASLGGCYGDSDYERVVKAELALEAMHAELSIAR